MTFALFGIFSIYTGIQKFMSAAAHLQKDAAQNATENAAHAAHSRAISPHDGRLAKQLALRVLRVSEQGEAPHCAGRMVISGRMADVCAELDRLVALEAQNKAPIHH
jgi:hypothetical protein